MFIYKHFFERRRRRSHFAQGGHQWMQQELPPALIVLVCTALHHALEEWPRNGGIPPVKELQRTAQWEYFFNRAHDGGWCAPCHCENCINTS